jgi:hypothetical protein
MTGCLWSTYHRPQRLLRWVNWQRPSDLRWPNGAAGLVCINQGPRLLPVAYGVMSEKRPRAAFPIDQVNGKPGGSLFGPIRPWSRSAYRRCDAWIRTNRPGFPPALAAYFFLAARPRPAGAARNEMPVRIAFC